MKCQPFIAIPARVVSQACEPPQETRSGLQPIEAEERPKLSRNDTDYYSSIATVRSQPLLGSALLYNGPRVPEWLTTVGSEPLQASKI